MVIKKKLPWEKEEKKPWEEEEKKPWEEEEKKPWEEEEKKKQPKLEKKVIKDQSTQPVISRDETGKIVGVELPDGRKFFGLSPSKIKALTEGYTATRQLPTGAIEAEVKRAEQDKERIELERRQTEAKKLEQEGLFPPEEAPEKVELDIEEKAGEGIPVVGSGISGIGQAIASYLKGTLLKSFVGDEQEIDSLIQTPEGRRGLMISEIQREELDRAISLTEAFGSIIEGIPVVGSLANQYAGDLLKTPEATTQDLRDQLREIEGRASGLTDAAAQGELGNGLVIARQLNDMDREVARLEAKIKLLSTISPILRSNPEIINTIEQEILQTRATIFEAQQRVAEGLIITKPEENLYMQLKEAKS